MIHESKKKTKGRNFKMKKEKKEPFPGMLFATALILPFFIGQIPAVGKMLLP